ncbi:MAG: hypothetical protein ACKOSS_04915 [Planctomycetia bacterium]
MTPADEPPPLRAIGPERLRALREAILNGTYPTQDAVEEGLTRLFRGTPPGEGPDRAPPTGGKP